MLPSVGIIEMESWPERAPRLKYGTIDPNQYMVEPYPAAGRQDQTLFRHIEDVISVIAYHRADDPDIEGTLAIRKFPVIQTTIG
jgi:hypothetical protein